MLTIDASTFRSRRTGGSSGTKGRGYVRRLEEGGFVAWVGNQTPFGDQESVGGGVERHGPASGVSSKRLTTAGANGSKFGADQQHEGVEVFWHQEPGAADPIVDGSRLAMRGLGSDQAGQAPAAGSRL